MSVEAASSPELGFKPGQVEEPDDVPVAKGLDESGIYAAYLDRVAEGRDMRTIIDAGGSTGVGKTQLGIIKAKLQDPWMWSADKGHLDPREFSVHYDEVPKLSTMILEEAEQALDRRRSMSEDVIAIGMDFSTKRYRQVFGELILPSKGMIDARIADVLCDFWIHLVDVGRANVYKLDQNEFTGQVYYKKIEVIEWAPIDDDRDYREMERKKRERMTRQTQSRYVHRDEFERMKENFWNKAEARTKYDLINAVYDASRDDDSPVDITQTALGQCVGMSQSNVSKIVNADGFEDFYKSYSG